MLPTALTPIIAYQSQRTGAGLPMAPVVLSEIGIPQAMRFTQVDGVGFGPAGRQQSLCGEPQWRAGDLGFDHRHPDALALYQGHGAGPGKTGGRPLPETGQDVAELLHPQSRLHCAGWSSMKAAQATIGSSRACPRFPATPPRPAQLRELDATSTDNATTCATAKHPAGGSGPRGRALRLSPGGGRLPGGQRPVASANQLLQGVQVFEFSDEWRSWMDPSVTDATTIQTAAGVHDFRDAPTAPGARRTRNSTPAGKKGSGSASALVRPVGRNSTDPAIRGPTAWLTGGVADQLTTCAPAIPWCSSSSAQ